MSGRGRGRGRKAQTVSPPVEIQELSDQEFSPPEDKPSRKRPTAKTMDDLRRVMDIIQSRISVIIDSLEGDDNDISLKRNVVTAVKHLKQINTLLE